MKLMISSDVHGSAYYCKILLEYFEKLKDMFQKINTELADKITDFWNDYKESNKKSIDELSKIIPKLKGE